MSCVPDLRLWSASKICASEICPRSEYTNRAPQTERVRHASVYLRVMPRDLDAFFKTHRTRLGRVLDAIKSRIGFENTWCRQHLCLHTHACTLIIFYIKTKQIMYETYDHLTYRELMNDACDGPTLDPKRANT